MESKLTARRSVLKTLAAGSAAAALVMAFGSSRVEAAVKHPHIREAIKELKEAKKELEEGAKVFGGHRVKAIKAIEEAIEQLEAALKFADRK